MTSAVVAELTRQHAHLRALLDRCDALLADADQGAGDVAALATAARAIALALRDHHAYEEAHLTLVGDDPRHHEQHVAMSRGLDDPSVRAFAAVLRDLREHLRREDALLATVTGA